MQRTDVCHEICGRLSLIEAEPSVWCSGEDIVSAGRGLYCDGHRSSETLRSTYCDSSPVTQRN